MQVKTRYINSTRGTSSNAQINSCVGETLSGMSVKLADCRSPDSHSTCWSGSRVTTVSWEELRAGKPSSDTVVTCHRHDLVTFLPRVKTLPYNPHFCFNLNTAVGNNENNGSWIGKIPLPNAFTKKCLSFLTISTFPRSFGALNMENSAFNNKSLLINFDCPKSVAPYTC